MKKTISIAVILLITFILTACTGGVAQSEYSDLQNQLAELQDQLEESQQTSQPTIAPTPTPTLAPTPVPTPSPFALTNRKN